MNLWFISDTHFGHANILKFTNNGVRIRPEFTTVEEMDEAMVERWNAVVKPFDHVYHLGDVAMSWQAMDAIMPRLRGKKRLIRGNHDIFKTKQYLKWFEEIKGFNTFDFAPDSRAKLAFTHFPIHELSMGRYAANVHGHIHEKPEYGPRYLNISVERINYQPVSLDQVRASVRMRQEEGK